MAELTPGIQLTNNGIDEVKDLCAMISRKNHKNEISVKMAEGIAEFVEAHGVVSGKQSEWLARNADFYKLPRPAELANVKVPRKSKQVPTKRADTLADLWNADDGFNEEVVATLKTLVRLFESRI